MLRIHEVTSATGAQRYYAASDYYSEGQETIGAWGGKLAERLGLAGKVTKEAFDRLCENQRPDGSPLTPRTNGERRVGYDFVFSAPKSYSVIEALAPEPERWALRAAFDQAVAETMREDVEPDARCRVRIDGADHDRLVGNLLWASFDHSTSRPVDNEVPDMHRHAHVLCFNAVWDPEEQRIKAGQFAGLKRDGEYYTAAFYARLAGKLERLGYHIDRSRGLKEWELAGVPQGVIDLFSKRTREVEEEHEARLRNDPNYRPEHKHELGAKTRAGKQKELTPEELRATWDGQLTNADRQALEKVWKKKIAAGPKVAAREAAAYAIAHCLEKESVVPERELQRVALLYGLGTAAPAEVSRELARQGMIVREIDDRRMATTHATLAEERAYVGFAANGLGTVAPIGLPDGLDRGTLRDDQWRALAALLSSSDRVTTLLGPAGAGKSTLLRAYDQAARAQGESVVYLGTSSDAVDNLRKEGFTAHTLAHFLLDERMREAARGSRVVLDEASLLSHRDAVRFLDAAKRLDLKPVLVGDRMQHANPAAGAPLRVLGQYGGCKPVMLDEIKRQQSAPYRAAVKELSLGNALAGFDALDRLGFVREIREGDRGWHIANDYLRAARDKASCIVIAPTHREGDEITARIRGMLKREEAPGGKGKTLLGAEEKIFTRLAPRHLTEAERGDARNFADGDVLVFHQNGKGIKNGARLVVGKDVDRSRLPLRDAGKFSVYTQETIALAAGDRLRFTGRVLSADKVHKCTNGSTYTVGGFTKNGDIRLQENGWIIPATAGFLGYGYVSTSFAAQGRTTDRAIVAISSDSLPATNRETLYVASSRARQQMVLYTDDKAAVRGAVRRATVKRAALDLVRTHPWPKLAQRIRTWSARRRHQAALAHVRASHDSYRLAPQERQVAIHGR